MTPYACGASTFFGPYVCNDCAKPSGFRNGVEWLYSLSSQSKKIDLKKLLDP